MTLDMKYFNKLMESDFLIKEEDNFHIKKDSPIEIINLMKEFRKLVYDDDNIYGEPMNKSFSETINDLLKVFSK